MSRLAAIILLVVAIGLNTGVAGAATSIVRGKPAKHRGDWRDLARDEGWEVFNEANQPFNTATNFKYCNRSRATISYSPEVGDYADVINRVLMRMRQRSKPGGSVMLGPGVFPVRRQIRMPSFTCLLGAGMRETRIRLVDNAPTFKQAGLVRSAATTRVTVADLTIDGNRKGQNSMDLHGAAYGRYGLFTQLTNFLYLKSVSVRNNIGYGFDPHGSKLEWAYYLLLEGCEAVNNGLDGFTLDQTYYVTLKQSWAKNNDRHGLNIVTGTRYVQVVENVMKGNGFDSGVGCNMMAQNNQQFGTKHIRYSYNRLVNARKAGYCFDDVSDVVVRRSIVENDYVESFCYYFSNTTDLNVDSTTCRKGTGHKVWSRNGAEFEL